MDKSFRYKRILVIGSTGAGKTTFARQLAARLNIPYIELDSLYWEPNWTARPLYEFRADVEEFASGEAWIADGNYTSARDALWPRAQVVIWLDYGFWLTFGRLMRRTYRRIFTSEKLWNGNRENVWNSLKLWSKDSLIHWFFKTFWRRRREIPEVLRWPEHSHLTLVRLRSPREAQEWLSNIL